MIKLFTYENNEVKVDPEALLLAPFKKVWTRDKNRNKSLAMMELGFIYFFCDPRSDYQYIINPIEREREIKLGEGLPKDWKPDAILQEAMDFYSSFKPLTSKVLEDTRVAVDKVRAFLRDVDLNALDDRGKPLYTVNTITSAIKLIPSLIKDLQEVEKALKTEITEASRVRGNNTKSVLEDD